MNWLAKINLSIAIKRLGTFRSALLIFSTLALTLYCGYRLGNYYNSYQHQTITQQKIRLDALYAEQGVHLKQIHTLEVEMEVERLANQKIQKAMKEMEINHFAVKKELAFYQKVMAPEKQANGLIIDAVEVSATQSPDHYRFAVVLVQQELKKRFATGYVEVEIAGSQNNKPSKLSLLKISQHDKDDLSFSLKYFQRVTGEFTLPKDFLPESIYVKAVLPKGRWQKASHLTQEFDWQNIFQG